jgi:hypothetical protein
MVADIRKCRDNLSGVNFYDILYPSNVSMSFQGPLLKCSSYQFLKIIKLYCTTKLRIVCVVLICENFVIGFQYIC